MVSTVQEYDVMHLFDLPLTKVIQWSLFSVGAVFVALRLFSRWRTNGRLYLEEYLIIAALVRVICAANNW